MRATSKQSPQYAKIPLVRDLDGMALVTVNNFRQSLAITAKAKQAAALKASLHVGNGLAFGGGPAIGGYNDAFGRYRVVNSEKEAKGHAHVVYRMIDEEDDLPEIQLVSSDAEPEEEEEESADFRDVKHWRLGPAKLLGDADHKQVPLPAPVAVRPPALGVRFVNPKPSALKAPPTDTFYKGQQVAPSSRPLPRHARATSSPAPVATDRPPPRAPSAVLAERLRIEKQTPVQYHKPAYLRVAQQGLAGSSAEVFADPAQQPARKDPAANVYVSQRPTMTKEEYDWKVHTRH